ncbi:LOW QUALITY PROTEIN: hypothetical protein CVT26_002504 [Gymnopilus dilepis]|uniref:Uncharacterized protein n=1 Tax=Gymnopilus dilepis TaxID=231916 RepID=A0A409YWZ1_9AGAR|nr:LOW QUALITY PROTEIN: hypothetical protein CVT26_002504 [Gymnopilus dilepis]
MLTCLRKPGRRETEVASTVSSGLLWQAKMRARRGYGQGKRNRVEKHTSGLRLGAREVAARWWWGTEPTIDFEGGRRAAGGQDIYEKKGKRSELVDRKIRKKEKEGVLAISTPSDVPTQPLAERRGCYTFSSPLGAERGQRNSRQCPPGASSTTRKVRPPYRPSLQGEMVAVRLARTLTHLSYVEEVGIVVWGAGRHCNASTAHAHARAGGLRVWPSPQRKTTPLTCFGKRANLVALVDGVQRRIGGPISGSFFIGRAMREGEVIDLRLAIAWRGK